MALAIRELAKQRGIAAAVCLALLCAALPAAALADLLPAGETARTLPITLRDGKPMLAARVGDRSGVLMVDIGTPYPLMLNRDALDLPAGREVARGHAASGQEIVVMLHPAPSVAVAGRAMPLPDTLPSGNFGFTRDGLGADFLGFLGFPVLAGSVFALDLGNEQGGGWLTLLATAPGAPGAPPALASMLVDLSGGGLPRWQGKVGDRPMDMDIDTGDGGTFYVTERTRTALRAGGLLNDTGARGTLTGLALGGRVFGPIEVRLAVAGGPEDMRDPPQGDLLRLGAGFLAQYPTLWDLPGRTIHILDPEQAGDFAWKGQRP